MSDKIKIIFFGSSDFSVSILSRLMKENYNIAVITNPDKPTGRKGKLSPSIVKKFARENGLELLELETFKSEESFNNFSKLKPDLCLVASYGKIIPERYLSFPKFGFLNVHPSLLPKYRGPSPIQTAILNGDKKTGVSIMAVDKELDHGPLLAWQEFLILNFQFSNSKELENKLAGLGAKLFIEILPKYINGEIKPKPQDHGKATFTKMFSRQDSKINWRDGSEKIYNQIRALNPEPGTWTGWKGKILNIKSAETVTDENDGRIGQVMKEERKILVKTGDGRLKLNKIQPEGGKEMDAINFADGRKDFAGSILE